MSDSTQQNTNPDSSTPATGAEQPLAYRAVRGGLWVIMSSYWLVGFGFVINIVLTRLLSPDVFGIFALAVFYSQLLRLQNKLGIGFAFVNYKDTTGESLGTYVVVDTVMVLVGMFGGVLVLWLAEPSLTAILIEQGNTAMQARAVIHASIMMMLATGLQGLGTTANVLLEKEMHFKQVSLLHSICVPVSYLPAVVLAVNGAGVWSLITYTYVQYILLLGGTFWLVYRHVPHIWRQRWRFNLNLAIHFLRFGFTVGLGVLATLLLTQLDNFFIGTFVGIAMLGYYDRAYRMAKWPSTLLGSLIARTVFQTYARLQDDRVRLQKTVSMVLWIITTLALPIVLVIFIAAPDMISLLYGEEWLPATIFLRILVVFAFIQPLWENATQLFVAIGKPRLSAVLMWAQVITLAVCGLPLTLLWGALGTCVAVAIAFAVGLFLIHHHISSEIDVNIGRALAVPLLISMMTLMGYLGLNYLTSLNELPLLARFLLKSSYATITFFGLMFLLQPSSTLGQVLYIWKLATRRKG